MKTLFLVLFYISFCMSLGFAQQNEIDCRSLLDSIIANNDIIKERVHDKNVDLFNNFLQLSIIMECEKEEGIVYVILGNIHKDNGAYDVAKGYYNDALKEIMKSKDGVSIASVYNNLISLEMSNKFPEHGLLYADTAIWYLTKSTTQKEKAESLRRIISVNKAVCLRELNRFDDARNVYLTLMNDTSQIEYPHALQGLGDIEYDEENYELALEYFIKARSEFEKATDSHSICMLQRSIGLVHLFEGDTSNAILYFLDSAEKARKIENQLLYNDAFSELLALSSIHSEAESASMILVDSLSHDTIEVGNYIEKIELLSGLAELYSKNNNFEQAFYYQKKIQSIDSTLIAKIKMEQKLSADYKAKLANRKIITSFVLGILFLILIALIYINKKEREKRQVQEEKSMLELQHASEMLNVSHDLRERLAFETHDVKTIAAGLRNQLQFVVEYFEKTDKTKNIVEEVYSISESLFEQIRRINKTLDPNPDEWYEQLERLLKQLNKDNKITTQINKSEEFNFEISSNLGYKIYTILSVLLDNVKEHSKATELKLNLLKAEDSINIILEDNGVGGFDYPKEEGIGLRSVRKRVANELKGNFEINTDNGTKIKIFIPLKSD